MSDPKSEISFALITRSVRGSDGREYLMGSINDRGLINLGDRDVVVYLPDSESSLRTGLLKLVEREDFRHAVRGEPTATINVSEGNFPEDHTNVILERSQIQFPLIWKRDKEGKDCLIGSVEFPMTVDLSQMTWIIFPKFEFSKSSPLRGDAKCIVRANNRIRESKDGI